MPIDHLPIRRDARSGTDQHQVALLECRHRNRLGLVAMVDALGGIGHQLGQLIERPGGLPHGAHLQPVTQKHDVDQRDQLPEEALAQVQELGGDAVDQRHRDRQRDKRHHARLALAQLGDGHLQERYSAIEQR